MLLFATRRRGNIGAVVSKDIYYIRISASSVGELATVNLLFSWGHGGAYCPDLVLSASKESRGADCRCASVRRVLLGIDSMITQLLEVSVLPACCRDHYGYNI